MSDPYPDAARLRPAREWTRGELAELLGGRLEGPDGPARALRDPGDAGPYDVVVARVPKYLASSLESAAGLVVLADDASAVARDGRALLRVRDLEVAWGALLAAFFPRLDRAGGVHPAAFVHEGAELGDGVHVGPFAVVSRGARVGAGAVIGAHAFVGEGAVVGRDCLLHPRATVLHGVTLGDRVVVQSGAVIGSDGYGFRRDERGHFHRLPHIGTTVIEDDVEIGAGCIVDRGTVGETRIGARSKLGPVCIVAHNGRVGRDVLMIGAVQLAGSVTVEDRAILMGQVGVVGHVTIGAGATVTAQSGVSKDLAAGGTYRGAPAHPIREQLRVEAHVYDLERGAARVRELEERVRRLEAQLERALDAVSAGRDA